MSIISASDFVYDYTIPNRTQESIEDEINWYIAKYEPILLDTLLGADLYSLLLLGLAEDPILTKWQTLSDKVKISIINYVYWYIRKANVTQTGGASESLPVNENSTVFSPEDKMMERWNEGVENNFSVVRFIKSNIVDYGIYLPTWLNSNVLIPSQYRGVNCVNVPDIFVKQTWL